MAVAALINPFSLVEKNEAKKEIKPTDSLPSTSPSSSVSKRQIAISLRKRIIEMLKNSSANGLPNMMRTSNVYLKAMWLTCFTLSTCVCSYYVLDGILDYLKYSTVTTVKMIQEHQAQFPTVSLCASPQFNASSIEQIISKNF